MSRAKGNKHTTGGDWTNIEEKVPDDVPEQPRSITVRTGGKGKKGGLQKLFLPRSMIPETKRMFSYFWDAETLDAPSGGASSFFFLQDIAQGSNSTQRIGDSIFVKRIVIRLIIDQSAGNNTTTANLALIKDTEPAAASPAWTDLFQGIGGSSAAMYNVAIPNFDERSRFKYLKRITQPLVWQAAYYNAAAFGTPQVISLTLVQEVNQQVSYNGTSATPERGAEISLWGWSDLTANTPKCNASMEIFFTDV